MRSFRVVCLCNKIKRGTSEKAIASGSTTIGVIRMRTRTATGPCGDNKVRPRHLPDAARRGLTSCPTRPGWYSQNSQAASKRLMVFSHE